MPIRDPNSYNIEQYASYASDDRLEFDRHTGSPVFIDDTVNEQPKIKGGLTDKRIVGQVHNPTTTTTMIAIATTTDAKTRQENPSLFYDESLLNSVRVGSYP